MANVNPLAGVVPQVVHPVNDGETTITEYVEKIEGEVALDTYVKAQVSAPEVVKRITELENSLQRLASAVMTSIANCAPPPKRPNSFSKIASKSTKANIASTPNWDESRSRVFFLRINALTRSSTISASLRSALPYHHSSKRNS
jgi:hypothetical protein